MTPSAAHSFVKGIERGLLRRAVVSSGTARRRKPSACHAPLRAPSIIGAEAWFDTAGADRYDVHEQTYLVPGGDVVTLLLLPSKMLV
jgi:hypothetical protein